PLIPSRLNPPFHPESLVSHINCLFPHFEFYQSSFPTPSKLPSSLGQRTLRLRVTATQSPPSIVRTDVFNAR
ncbi:hypothetical protein K443DRAFT_115280, partial [Laccaria amethystina LaAM-08-1]